MWQRIKCFFGAHPPEVVVEVHEKEFLERVKCAYCGRLLNVRRRLA